MCWKCHLRASVTDFSRNLTRHSRKDEKKANICGAPTLVFRTIGTMSAWSAAISIPSGDSSSRWCTESFQKYLERFEGGCDQWS